MTVNDYVFLVVKRRASYGFSRNGNKMSAVEAPGVSECLVAQMGLSKLAQRPDVEV